MLCSHLEKQVWFVNQPLHPEGQNWGQTSCDPLEYQHRGSVGIKEHCLRKWLRLSGSQYSDLAFQNFSYSLGWDIWEMVKIDKGVPSEDIYLLTQARFFTVRWSHCKYRQNYSSKSSQMEVTFALSHAVCLTAWVWLFLYGKLICSLSLVSHCF